MWSTSRGWTNTLSTLAGRDAGRGAPRRHDARERVAQLLQHVPDLLVCGVAGGRAVRRHQGLRRDWVQLLGPERLPRAAGTIASWSRTRGRGGPPGSARPPTHAHQTRCPHTPWTRSSTPAGHGRVLSRAGAPRPPAQRWSRSLQARGTGRRAAQSSAPNAAGPGMGLPHLHQGLLCCKHGRVC